MKNEAASLKLGDSGKRAASYQNAARSSQCHSPLARRAVSVVWIRMNVWRLASRWAIFSTYQWHSTLESGFLRRRSRESLLPRLHSTCLSRQLPALFRFISRAPLYTSPIMRNKKKLTISVEHFASEKVFIGAKNLYRCRVSSALTRLYFPLSSHGARYQGEKTVIAHCCFGGFGGEQKWARS